MANVQTYAHGDQYGLDPLRNKLYQKMHTFDKYTEHVVTPDEEGNPALLANDYYQDPDLDFLILAYNGIGNGMSLKAGQVLKIPSRQQVLALPSVKSRVARI